MGYENCTGRGTSDMNSIIVNQTVFDVSSSNSCLLRFTMCRIIYRRFDRMCYLQLQGACGINWGIEKSQLCTIFAEIVPGKHKFQGLPSQRHESPEGVTCRGTLSLTSAVDVVGWSTPRPDRFTPGNEWALIVYEAGWATGTVWTSAENLSHAGIRSSNRPTRSQSLHPMRYPGPILPSSVHNGHVPFSKSLQKQH